MTRGVGFATDTTGVKASYTAPSNKRAAVRDYTIRHVGGVTAVIQINHDRAATNLRLDVLTAGVNRVPSAVYVCMEAADVFELEVTTAGAVGNTADGSIHADEEL